MFFCNSPPTVHLQFCDPLIWILQISFTLIIYLFKNRINKRWTCHTALSCASATAKTSFNTWFKFRIHKFQNTKDLPSKVVVLVSPLCMSENYMGRFTNNWNPVQYICNIHLRCIMLEFFFVYFDMIIVFWTISTKCWIIAILQNVNKSGLYKIRTTAVLLVCSGVHVMNSCCDAVSVHKARKDYAVVWYYRNLKLAQFNTTRNN